MKLYLREPFVWERELPLVNGRGQTRYTFAGDAYRMGKRLVLRDLAAREAARLRQKIPGDPAACVIEVYGKPLGMVTRCSPDADTWAVLPELGWEILSADGGFQILRNQEEIGSAYRGADSVLEFTLQSDPPAVLAALLSCECILLQK